VSLAESNSLKGIESEKYRGDIPNPISAAVIAASRQGEKR
jgi:hypothetical protein